MNLIIKIEAEVFEQIGEEIIVVDEAAVIIGNSPFQTVKSLTEFVYKKIRNEKKHLNRPCQKTGVLNKSD